MAKLPDVEMSIAQVLHGIVKKAVHFDDLIDALNQVQYEAARDGNPVPPTLDHFDGKWVVPIIGRRESLTLEQAARAFVEGLIKFGKDHADD